MDNEQDVIIWKLQKDLTRARLALARIYDIVDKIHNWKTGYCLFEMECDDVEEIAKTLQEFFKDGSVNNTK